MILLESLFWHHVHYTTCLSRIVAISSMAFHKVYAQIKSLAERLLPVSVKSNLFCTEAQLFGFSTLFIQSTIWLCISLFTGPCFRLNYVLIAKKIQRHD